ncbi:TBC1 domain family member 1 like protein [Argiope bruennichi]|uniref:TBC1 domain family member 1 like protein n=1 Tax=Argiope bruennichi TaxID=94029 RepID=A0A8T0F006_ARGBR|nr:TBC1 domain family member 1 like protein [Argiope bruennichi]
MNDTFKMSHQQSNLKSSKDLETFHSNEKCNIPKSESFSSKNSTNHVTFQRTYRVFYLGYAVLDRRYTLPMLPWVIAEIKRHGSDNEEEIDIEVTEQSLKATSCATKMLIFEHKLQTISKFAQSSQDPSCFTYMTREVSAGPCAYHVFQANNEKIVIELFTAMREMSKEMHHPVLTKTSSGVALETIIHGCQQYEVLYLGRIKVSGKRAPPTFIDDAVEKFRLFEMEKTRSHHGISKRRRHGSGASVSSLPYTLDVLEKPYENGLQKQIKLSSKEDLSSSSGVSSSESISQKSLDILSSNQDTQSINQIYCDTDPAVHSPQNSLLNSDLACTFPVHSQSLVSHSQSMDIATAAQMLTEFKHSDFKCSLMPPSSLITHTQSLDAPACADIVRDLRDIDPGVILRDRVRSCSGDIPRAKQTSLPTFHNKGAENSGFCDVRRPRAYTSPNPSDNRQCNRTMLFLIGRMEICLIGTDKKQMLMCKTFNDIAHCSQGVKHLDHFGFICRETTLSGADCYSGYIFRCQTEKVVDEMMQTLKLAFSKAHQNYQKLLEKSIPVPKVFICDSCPMHWFHKLCSDVEGLSPEEAHLIILRRLGNSNKVTRAKKKNLMMLLRELCEQKQLKHTHNNSAHLNGKNALHVKEKSSKLERLDSFRQKAKKSLSSSFETFLKLTNREDLKDSSSGLGNRAASVSEQPSKDLDTRSYREGSCDSSRYLSERTSPLSTRPRSSTFTSSREVKSPSSKKINNKQDSSQNKRPIMNMFMKASTPIKTPSTGQTESKGSWRQAIFHRVQTPNRSQNTHVSNEGHLSHGLLSDGSKFHVKKTKEELRALWKKAILEQILLIRMDKENMKLQVNQDAVCHKRMKLNYEEITPCIKTTIQEWDEILNDPKRNERMDKGRLMEMVKKGVPRHRRGEIWQYLTQQSQDVWCGSSKDLQSNETYDELLKQLTSHQHSILIDIGRTFPNHPFYSQTLGPGQLSLFNLLKAYSLLDKEVGYCQGLSFVAGILLLHMPEDQAFSLMKYLMFNLGLRRQYKTDMVAFQIQMYQLSRLIHDNYRDLYDHLEKFDIAPTLYAAPWFLTLFASQFPVGFVARLFDLIFLCGMEVIFKVSLLLLGNYKDCILNCDSFESAMNFLKVSLPSIEVFQMEIIFNQVFNLDITRQLHAYEVEYHVLLEEMVHSPSKDCEELENLRSANKKLKAQNMELMEQLQVAYSRIHSLETSNSSLKSTEKRLEENIACLLEEKEDLIYTLKIMKKRFESREVARLKRESTPEEEEEHPPPFGVVYALAGTEKEEDEHFRAFIKKYCQGKAVERADDNKPSTSGGNESSTGGIKADAESSNTESQVHDKILKSEVEDELLSEVNVENSSENVIEDTADFTVL